MDEDLYERTKKEINGDVEEFDDDDEDEDEDDDKKSKINLTTSNVIKYYLNDNMWFVLRPSGTEPKLKVYYGVVGKTDAEAKAKLEGLKAEVMAIVNLIK